MNFAPINEQTTLEMLLRALNHIQEGITAIDKEGYVRFVNDEACVIMGVKKEELLNQKVDQLANGKPLLLKVIESKSSIIDVEYFLKFKNKTIHLFSSGYPIYDEQGEVVGAIDIFRSVQRARKFANNLAGYQAIFTFDHLIGDSGLLKDSKRLAEIFAKTDENVLIIGESGTGKELFAQAIHNYSDRQGQPFVALNCANFPDELIDSELFGYEEGAFTGALKGGKPGKFELAQGGTLFLDEIGEMPIHLQAKLLRVLETKTITRIGGNKLIHVDVRILTATNRNLEILVEEGRFRQDLYFRLKVLFLAIPPLRDRANDILLLAEHFIKKIANKAGKKQKTLTKEAKKILTDYKWPGNIRELENTMSRAVFVEESGYITAGTLIRAGLTKSCNQPEETGRRPTHHSVSKEVVVKAMQDVANNKRRAAGLLGISRPTLYKLLKKYEIND